jgi:hypothetical protein
VKLLFKLLLLLILLTPILLVGGLLFSLSDNPEVQGSTTTLTSEDVKRAKQILKTHKPDSLTEGSVRNLSLTPDDLNLTANYLIQRFTPGNASITLGDNSAHIALSAQLPQNPFGRYFNLDMQIQANRQAAQISHLRMGKLQIPSALTQLFLDAGIWLLADNPHWQLFQQTLDDISITPQHVSIRYRWLSQWEQLARQQLDQQIDKTLMRYYAKQLSALHPIKTSSFRLAMQTLFKQAASRSQQNDPIEENRALLFVLGNWALGRRAYHAAPVLPVFRLQLRQRRDLAQHFLVSAAIAANGDSLLSTLVGLGKEISDADGGSGFSFADLTADRAGTLLGDLAVRSHDSALAIQQKLAALNDGNDLLPPIDQLPAPMTQQQFQQQYGDTKGLRYQQQVEQIDQLINTTAFFADTKK